MYMLWSIIRSHIRTTHDPHTMMWEIWQKLAQKKVKIYEYVMEHYKSSYKGYTLGVTHEKSREPLCRVHNFLH